jgi:hypothetical protein
MWSADSPRRSVSLAYAAIAGWRERPKREPRSDQQNAPGIKEQIKEVSGDDAHELKEEALRGLEFQQRRSAGVEQRASFLLAAAGLSSSLVLANAGLLLGNVELDPPWLQLAAASLALASVCAAITGLRAIQATMFDFVQVLPHTMLLRRKSSGDKLVRSYIAQLQVAEFRERAVTDWKSARMISARKWFFGALAGIALLTMFVLVEVVQRTPSENGRQGGELQKPSYLEPNASSGAAGDGPEKDQRRRRRNSRPVSAGSGGAW